MIQEAYVSFETAKLLKEKGFNEPTLGNYYIDGRFEESCRVNWNEYFKTPINAPTQQMAMRWLREVYNVNISISYFPIDKDYGYCINYDESSKSDDEYGFEKYEQASEAAIKYCLENLI